MYSSTELNQRLQQHYYLYMFKPDDVTINTSSITITDQYYSLGFDGTQLGLFFGAVLGFGGEASIVRNCAVQTSTKHNAQRAIGLESVDTTCWVQLFLVISTCININFAYLLRVGIVVDNAH